MSTRFLNRGVGSTDQLEIRFLLECLPYIFGGASCGSGMRSERSSHGDVMHLPRRSLSSCSPIVFCKLGLNLTFFGWFVFGFWSIIFGFTYNSGMGAGFGTRI